MIKSLVYFTLCISILFWGSDLAEPAPDYWRFIHFSLVLFTLAAFEIRKKGIFLRVLRGAAFMLCGYFTIIFLKDQSLARFLSYILTLGAP